MKEITNKVAVLRLGITLSFILSLLTIGYSTSPYPHDELLIRFEPGTTIGYIDSLRTEYNATEDINTSPSPVTEVHLWRITQFPTGGNNDLNDINEVVGNARGRAKIKSAGLNYKSKVFSLNFSDAMSDIIDPTYLCPEQFSITCNHSEATVRMAILDTGIGLYENANNTLDFYSPNLFNPFYKTYRGYNFVNQSPNPIDDHGHGSHIAGIIAGIATLSKAYNIEMESFKTHDEDGVGYIYDISY